MLTDPASDPIDDVLTFDEVATILRVPVGTLRTWRGKGEGPAGFRAGKYVRFRRSSVERFITEQENKEEAQ
jgi:excisionase family DNA binding protein